MKRLIPAAFLAATLAFGGTALAQPKTALSVSIFSQDIGTLDPDFAVGTQDRVPVAWIFNALTRFKPGHDRPQNARTRPGTELG